MRPYRYHRPRSSSLRLWARLRPHGPGEIAPPAESTPQPAPGTPAINVHTGTPVLPSSQARPSASPALILPLLLLTLAFPTQASAFYAFSAVINLRFFAVTDFRVTPCTPSPVPSRANTSRFIQALTGRPIKTATRLRATKQRDRRDCSDLSLGRLARLSACSAYFAVPFSQIQNGRPDAKEVGVKNPAEENDRTAYFNPAFHVPKLIA